MSLFYVSEKSRIAVHQTAIVFCETLVIVVVSMVLLFSAAFPTNERWISLKDFPFVSGTNLQTNTVQAAANAAKIKNVGPTPMVSVTLEKDFVTMNAISQDIDPLKLLAIALASVVNISPTRTCDDKPNVFSLEKPRCHH